MTPNRRRSPVNHSAHNRRSAVQPVLHPTDIRMIAPVTADDLRALGWTVAVHNDYKMRGKMHTFWLFTKGTRFAKGEALTDREALQKVYEEILRIGKE
jgi:hypothetical protein